MQAASTRFPDPIAHLASALITFSRHGCRAIVVYLTLPELQGSPSAGDRPSRSGDRFEQCLLTRKHLSVSFGIGILGCNNDVRHYAVVLQKFPIDLQAKYGEFEQSVSADLEP